MVLYVCSEKKNALCCSFVLLCMPTKRFLPRTLRQQCMKITYGKTPEIEFSICGVLHQREMSHTHILHPGIMKAENTIRIFVRKEHKKVTHTQIGFSKTASWLSFTNFLSWFNFSCIVDQTLITMWKFKVLLFNSFKLHFFLTVKTVLIACQFSLYPLPQLILFRSVSGILKYQLISTYTMKRS